MITNSGILVIDGEDGICLSPETEGLTRLKDLRRHYGDYHGIKVEALADREVLVMDNQHTRLIAGWCPKSPTGFTVPQSHKGIV